MRLFMAIGILLVLHLPAFGQEEHSPLFRKGNLLVGFGLGTKSHLGNWGLTSNLFFSRSLNLKFSAGGGQFDFNGFLLSLGPEYNKQFSHNKSFLLGTTWAIVGGTEGVINDQGPKRREYSTNSNQYIRTYGGLLVEKDGSVFKFEIGYSLALKPPTFVVTSNWTTSEIEKMERSMGSGLMLSFSGQGIFR